jgi:TRAP-type C4-dicarboxylate transport system permease small subunit
VPGIGRATAKESVIVSWLRWAGRALFRIERLLVGGAAMAMIVIMVLVVADVLLRYVFNSPLRWSYAVISRFLMIYVFFLALSDTLRRNEHVIVGFLVGGMGIRSRSVVELLASLPALVIFGLVVWLGIDLTWSQYVNHDVVMDKLGWPSWIASIALPVGMGLMVLRIVVRVCALGARAIDPQAEVTDAYGDAGDEETAMRGS